MANPEPGPIQPGKKPLGYLFGSAVRSARLGPDEEVFFWFWCGCFQSGVRYWCRQHQMEAVHD